MDPVWLVTIFFFYSLVSSLTDEKGVNGAYLEQVSSCQCACSKAWLMLACMQQGAGEQSHGWMT